MKTTEIDLTPNRVQYLRMLRTIVERSPIMTDRVWALGEIDRVNAGKVRFPNESK